MIQIAAATSVTDAPAVESTSSVATNLSSVGLSSTTVIAITAVIGVIFFAGWLLLRLPKAEDVETQKVRFAAATFTGILTIFVFAAVLYYIDPRAKGPGQDIFEKAMTAMTPLIGVIVGYLFGTKDKSASSPNPKKDDKPSSDTDKQSNQTKTSK